MKLTNDNCSFTGLTKIYSIADSHQETRKTSAFLSKILHDSFEETNVLLLNCGDIFKGIYPRALERDCYIKMKDAKPDLEMVMTLGNNDFGFNKESLDYLVDTVKAFAGKGIKTVCANIFKTDGSRPEWLKPYTVVERDGDRTFVTGFCINNINTAKFGIVAKNQTDVLNEIRHAILRENPDNVIVLNHDYMPSSQNIVQDCKKNGIHVDVVIGGHDHSFVEPDTKLNIYYPEAFSESMYRFNLENSGGVKKVSNVEMIENENLSLNPVFAKDLQIYEKESGLLDKLVPSTLHLPKSYSKPCPLGSFLADEMMKSSKSDLAFFSTGFLMKPMEYVPNSYITNYLFKKTIIAETPIKTVELSAGELKEVFQHALRTNGYGVSNPRFLQCSNNIRLEGKNNQEAGVWELKQIYIDNKPILDEFANPLPFADKKYKCAIDSYIADGGQGFNTLAAANKSDVICDGEHVKINEVLLKGLKGAADKYPAGFEYPCFKLDETPVLIAK